MRPWSLGVQLAGGGGAAVAASLAPAMAQAQLIKLGGPSHANLGAPVHFTPGDPAAQSGQLLFAANPESLRGLKTVAIPYFQVQFVTRSHAGVGRTHAAVSMTYDLDGVGPSEMQAITDALYAKFVADLAEAGLTVMSQDAAKAASPAYARLIAAGHASPHVQGTVNGTTSTFCAPASTPIYFTLLDPQFAGAANMGSRLHIDERQAAKELNAGLLGMRLVVNFVELESNARSMLGRMAGSARVKSKVDISVEGSDSNLWVLTPTSREKMGYPAERLRFEVNAPLVIAENVIVSTDETTTAGSKAGDAASMAAVMLLGGGLRTQKTRAYTVRVSPNTYVAEVGEALAGVEKMMVAKLKSEL